MSRSQIVRSRSSCSTAARQQRLAACPQRPICSWPCYGAAWWSLLLTLLQRRVVVTALLSMALPLSALPPLPQFISYYNPGYQHDPSGKPVFLPPYKYFGQFGVRGGQVSVHHPGGGRGIVPRVPKTS